MTDEERVSMRDYLDGKVEDLRREFLAGIVDMRRELQSEVSNQKEAVNKAERTMNERLAGMNEFRDTLKDQASHFPTIERLDEIREAVDKRLNQGNVQLAQLPVILQGMARLEEASKAKDLRLKVVEDRMSNWQGRLVVLGGTWSVVIILITALLNYFLRTVT